jgi:hypothetical protein
VLSLPFSSSRLINKTSVDTFELPGSPLRVLQELKLVSGVVEVGLFSDCRIHEAYFGHEASFAELDYDRALIILALQDGTVLHKSRLA